MVSTRCSGKLCWLTLRDVIGEALLSSEVVEFVILWCYGFGTVLDFFGWFRCESPADRLPGQPCARWSAQLRVQEHKRVRRERRERARALVRRFKLSGFVLNCPGLDLAHRRLVQSERRYGTEPRLHGCSCKAFSCDEKLLLIPVLKLLPGLHIYNITTFVILLIHTFLQPFIKV